MCSHSSDINITMYKDELAEIIGDIFCDDELTSEHFVLLFKVLETLDSNEEFKFIRTHNLIHGVCALVDKYSDNVKFCFNALRIIFHDFKSDKGIFKISIANTHIYFFSLREYYCRKGRRNDHFKNAQ